MTLKELYPVWVKEKSLYVKQSTMSAYNLLIKNHILPYWGEVSAEGITNNLLQDFVMSLVNKGLSNKTACDICIAVKMLVDFNSEKNNLPKIQYKLRYPTTNQKENKLEVYSPDEQKKILQYIIDNTTSESLAIAITLCTGMRIGEISALKWKNVDIENKQIIISENVQRIYVPDEDNRNRHDKKMKTKIIFDTPKTSSSHRIVPIVNILLPILKNYKRIMKDEYFVSTGSDKLTEPRVLREHYKTLIMDKIKLGRCIKFHGLRHSFATRLISTGTDAKTTSIILGHSKVEMTMNLYVHPSSENKMNAVNKSMKSLFK